MTPTDDELAFTATAPGPRPSAKKLDRVKLGRFTIESELGAGGMGVVHAAFDPDLERRVALKVLRATSADARARLLLEARAMAKLSHPNVITVFEVGSAEGEDFVAMELIDGGTLGDWIERTHPRPGEILAAFTLAGRGLVAAHAQGLVHRDFKPNNVLRSVSGRIVVTDFGLARAEGASELGEGGRVVAHADSLDSIALDRTQAPTAPALTRTGSLLGTPAYMSPEQWQSETVTPATDQFAFCVALWEALTGKRPFGGATLDALRGEVLHGPAELDAGALPRRLRPILRRGLARDPSARWPSMIALLAAIEHANAKRRWIAVGAGVALLAAAGVVVVATRSSVQESCVPPAIDPDSLSLAGDARAQLDRWRDLREAACSAPREVRTTRLACLDAVLARLADLARSGDTSPDVLELELVDPAVCEHEPLPHLVPAIDDRLSQAFAAVRLSRTTWKPVGTPLVAETQPACVRTLALLAELVWVNSEFAPTAAAKLAGLSSQLETAAQACDDDGIKATVLLQGTNPDDVKNVRRAEAAAKQFPSDAHLARLDEMHAQQAERVERNEDAIAGYERARARHAAAGRTHSELDAAIRLARARLGRSSVADLAAVIEIETRYHALAASVGRSTEIAILAARARWRQGDVAHADADARAAGYRYGAAPFVDSSFPTQDVAGVVVDDAGKPVANAKVVGAAVLWSDDVELSSPIAHVSTAVETTTASDGTFLLKGARGSVIAEQGDRVSMPVRAKARVKLQLGPTSTIEGDVALARASAGAVRVVVALRGSDTTTLHVTPVDATGHFKVARIPRGKVALAAIRHEQISGFDGQPLDVKTPAITGVHLKFEIAAGKLYIIGRSETSAVPESALVMVFRDAHPEVKGTFGHVFHVLGGPVGQVSLGPADPAALPPALIGHVESDDLIGEMAMRPSGPLTVCAVALTRKALAMGTSAEKLVHVIQDADAGCAVAPADAVWVTVTVPALKRIRP